MSNHLLNSKGQTSLPQQPPRFKYCFQRDSNLESRGDDSGEV
jgi:hypothetical protein